MSLSLKKRILSIVVGLILTGNILRLFSPTEVIVLDDFTNPVPAYAGSPYENNILVYPSYDFAYEESNYQSLQVKMDEINVDPVKVAKIERYLGRRGAPLATEADTFVKIADKYGLPYNLMPAISIVESSGGLHNYRPYNYAGMGGQSNAKTFANYEQAIEFHASFIRRGYFDRGATTPEAMEKFYCYQCPTWGEKVQSVMNSIDRS